MEKMWCRCSLFSRGRNGAFLLCSFFFDLKCNLKNLVLWQPTSHQTLINTDQHLFSAVHCSSFSKLKSKSTCSIHPVTLLWKFELKKKKKKITNFDKARRHTHTANQIELQTGQSKKELTTKWSPLFTSQSIYHGCFKDEVKIQNISDPL